MLFIRKLELFSDRDSPGSQASLGYKRPYPKKEKKKKDVGEGPREKAWWLQRTQVWFSAGT